ncbi:MAG: signal recognition particle-docking protein FtsY [Candidatus Marsarchaeota archaeon]|jgi:fused signal recognition particle receptor|nr:signal recognition particle-docking protein FtsY [Candidatus Marsarchaeota archaeon]MCL5111382.1 signal recognition particle-docking protein FtsY [Candidatus Marsarchaeota archaeon]
MFDELRKRISSAVKGFIKKEEKEAELPAETIPEGRGITKEPVLSVDTSVSTRIKGALTGSVKLSDDEVENFLKELEDSLLKSDVSYSATESFIAILRKKLEASRFKPREIDEMVTKEVRSSLLEMLKGSKPGIDLIKFVKERAVTGEIPVKILFLGPNGTGKTTTMGKIAAAMKRNGIESVFSASDTFRAAAIEQTEHHARAIGSHVIKSKYGADPASVAFDAIAYAKAHKIPAVLIDTAGRQETNRNLINEMMKMVKVAKPDITVFVGESTSGNALTPQIMEFSKYMKIDGIILTKLDCDAKGGNAVSIASTTGIPILFFGVGESYDALVGYTPEFVVDSILHN